MSDFFQTMSELHLYQSQKFIQNEHREVLKKALISSVQELQDIHRGKLNEKETAIPPSFEAKYLYRTLSMTVRKPKHKHPPEEK